MSATNGLARGMRSRTRMIGCVMAVACAMTGIYSSSSQAFVPPIKETYMALGDSLAFGYSKQLLDENLLIGDPASAFNHGYTNDYMNNLHYKAEGIQLQDLGCPGETTDSLIGNGPLASYVDPTGEAPCAYHNTDGLPLHVEYLPGTSQLETALYYLAVDAATGKPVTTLSLNIGANDQLHAVTACEEQVDVEIGEGKWPPTEAGFKDGLTACIVSKATSLGEHIGTNIGTTLYVLRKGAEFGSINYTGRIIFVGAYNPYGNLYAFPTKKQVEDGVNDEVLAGSNVLVPKFNAGFKPVVEAFGGCFANTDTKFNPQNSAEPRDLKAWTNMANTSESNGQKNGPDIHPTPAGYHTMASVMAQSCGI